MLEYRIALRRDRNQTKPETLANVAWWCFVDWAWVLVVAAAAAAVVRCSATFGTLQLFKLNRNVQICAFCSSCSRVYSLALVCACVCARMCLWKCVLELHARADALLFGCRAHIVLKTARMGYFSRLFSISSPFPWLLCCLSFVNETVWFFVLHTIGGSGADGDGRSGGGSDGVRSEHYDKTFNFHFGRFLFPSLPTMCAHRADVFVRPSEDTHVRDSFDSNMWLFCVWLCEYREHYTHSPKIIWNTFHALGLCHCSRCRCHSTAFSCCCFWWWRIFSPFRGSLALTAPCLCVCVFGALVCVILQKR